jgi:hypothetical protein
MAQPDMVKPRIDDQYWFDYSLILVTKASDSLDQAAAKIQTFSLWLWGIYTTLATVGFALAGKDLPWVDSVLIASTSILIIAVYWATVWVQTPLLSKFDPRSPNQIRNAYVTTITQKSTRLKFTQALSGVAGGMVAISLITASVSKPAAKFEPDFAAAITNNNGTGILSVTARVPGVDNVFISIESMDPPKTFQVTNIVLLPQKPEGTIQTSFQLPDTLRKVNLSLSWTNLQGSKTTICKTITGRF